MRMRSGVQGCSAGGQAPGTGVQGRGQTRAGGPGGQTRAGGPVSVGGPVPDEGWGAGVVSGGPNKGGGVQFQWGGSVPELRNRQSLWNVAYMGARGLRVGGWGGLRVGGVQSLNSGTGVFLECCIYGADKKPFVVGPRKGFYQLHICNITE